MKNTSPLTPPKPAIPYPVSLVYTIYRHGARLSEGEALERARATADRLGTAA